MWIQRILIMLAAMALAGCAVGPRVIDSAVTTQVAHAPGDALLTQPRYRFLQVAEVVGQPAQQQVQAMAAAALARVGAVQDDANPTVSVEAEAHVAPHWVYDLYGGPSNAQMALGFGGGGWGLGFGVPLYWDTPTQMYLTDVTLVLRDLQTGQILYDTRARHDGLRADAGVLQALFAAALEGYPNPPLGTRRVDVPLIPIETTEPAPTTPTAPPTQTPGS